MFFFDNFIVCYVDALTRRGRRDPLFDAILLIFLEQGLLIIVLNSFVRNLTSFSFIPEFRSRYEFILLTIPWMLVLKYTYSPKRIILMREKFYGKPPHEVKRWKILSYAFPCFLIAVFILLVPK